MRVALRREGSPATSNVEKFPAKEAMLKVILRESPLFFTSCSPIPPSPSLLHPRACRRRTHMRVRTKHNCLSPRAFARGWKSVDHLPQPCCRRDRFGQGQENFVLGGQHPALLFWSSFILLILLITDNAPMSTGEQMREEISYVNS